MGLGVWHEAFHALDEDGGDRDVAAFATRHFATFPTIEMSPSVFHFDELTATSHFDAAGDGFMGLEFHRIGDD